MTNLLHEYHKELYFKVENDQLNAFDQCIIIFSEMESVTPYPTELIRNLFKSLRENKRFWTPLQETLLYSAMLNASAISGEFLFTQEEWEYMANFDTPDHPELTAFLTDSFALAATILYGSHAQVTQDALVKLQPLVPYIQFIVDKNREKFDGNDPFIAQYLAMHDRLVAQYEGPAL